MTECLLCHCPVAIDLRRTHLLLNHTVEAIAFWREPDDSLRIFFAAVTATN